MSVVIEIDMKTKSVTESDILLKEFVNWKIFDKEAQIMHTKLTDNLIVGLDIFDAIGCQQDHKHQIYSAYLKIVKILKAGTNTSTFSATNKFTPVPGWNQYCRDLHKKARKAFIT